ncbi:MAG: CpaF family protein, partial [Bryobacteraceae bacterium]
MAAGAGFDVILPYIRPIEHLIKDPTISEIMVNGPDHVFVERRGVLEEVALDVPLSETKLRIAIQNIARTVGDDITEERPLLDA